ncbi:MAG TPA: tRNA epoxyqueuosine(34) reductase QueG [Candidatus Binatia bacterium]|nr:tRNA epoxyqueuosine(34) reductase QueG [Candidatus Binatia bacterium]
MFFSAEISDAVRRAASVAGFERAGIAAVSDAAELEYFPRWIAAGHAGEMKYMAATDEQGRLKRASLQHAAPWARSVVVCAINYNSAQPYSTAMPDKSRGWISRYAWGAQDYHDSVMRRLRQVESALHEACGTAPKPKVCLDVPEEITTRCYVDTGPIVERVIAKYAGIGWIGKNTCIINQKLGSWLFLGVILTSLPLAPEAASVAAPDRCGTCTRCIDACPTDAFLGPYQLNANRCIAYLTIEKRGSLPEDDQLRAGMGRHVFGCDICQDVCPWNRKAPVTKASEFEPRPGLVNPTLEWLAEMSEEDFQKTFRGSPLKRAKRQGVRRNAIVAMGNSGEEKFRGVLEKLREDEDPVVSEATGWALRQLPPGGGSA